MTHQKSAWLRGLVALAFLAGLTLSAGAQAAAGAATRPGPSLLYAPPVDAPQLQNTGPWRAKPIMVSGASAYRQGEFLYQDYLFDDLGAGSTIAYPTDPSYAGNAADIVEVRLKLVRGATAVRLTYNSMTDPTLVASTLALGSSPKAMPMPFGANTTTPAAVFVTATGRRGFATDAATGRARPGHVTVSTDLKRRQVDIRIPLSVWDPRGQKQRVALAAGLWDDVKSAYVVPQSTADDTHPGGAAGAAPSAFFNVAFRYTEPFFAAATARDRLGWHESQQSAALSGGTLGDFAATVDFAKLAAGADDDMLGQVGGVPVTGHLALIYASHFAPGQGHGASTNPCVQPCQRLPEYPGQLQPYTAYVPAGAPPRSGWGLSLFLHACGVNYTPGDTPVLGAVGDAKAKSIVISPNARGTCEWYWGLSAADVFEAWGDAARRWHFDRGNTQVYGFSMGGYGTYKLATSYPDLFARAGMIVGCVAANTQWLGEPTAPSSGQGTDVVPMVPSLRNVPLRSYAEVADGTCTVPSQKEVKDALDAHGYRYEWVHAIGAHTGVGVNYAVLAQFLKASRLNPDPAHVTYALNKAMDERNYGLDLHGAYWVTGVQLAGTSGAQPLGTVDVRSDGFGTADPASSVPSPTPGVEGQYQPYPNLMESRVWGPAPRAARADVLHVTTTNVRSLVIDPVRARVTCRARIQISSDVVVNVVLAGCHRTVRGGK